MASSDVAVHSDGGGGGGYANRCLEIGEFSVAATNRELVNLENAAVNIDNSTDVIIGPVTQFNVNGNVTIYQNKDGLPVGLKPQIDEKPEEPEKPAGEPTCRGDLKDCEAFASRPEVTINYTKRIGAMAVATLLVLAVLKVAVENLHQSSQKPHQPRRLNTTTPAAPPRPPHRSKLVLKPQWGGVSPSYLKAMHNQVEYVIIKHTGGAFCDTEERCKQLTKELQLRDIAADREDIAYNFLVGGDGNAYEGRGFAYSNTFSRFSYDIAVHGNFLYDQFYDYMQEATEKIIALGVMEGRILGNYTLLCHNQTEHVDSPGRNVYAVVKHWDHFSNGPKVIPI